MSNLNELINNGMLKYADKKGVSIEKLPYTNADKIRSMSDDELAEYITEKVEHGLCFYTGSSSDIFGFNRESDSKIHLSWLQSEVSNGN